MAKGKPFGRQFVPDHEWQLSARSNRSHKDSDEPKAGLRIPRRWRVGHSFVRVTYILCCWL